MRSASSAKNPRSTGIPVSPKSAVASVSARSAASAAWKRGPPLRVDVQDLDEERDRLGRSAPTTRARPHETDERVGAVAALPRPR